MLRFSTLVAGVLLTGFLWVQSTFVADNFETVSFSNNDGTVDWAGDWIEIDPAGSGPTSGNVRVSEGVFTLNDSPDTGQEPSLAREVNLVRLGADEAILSFDFATGIGVDFDDAVTIEISEDGGATYRTLEVLTEIVGASSGSRQFDITADISTNTRVRFRVSNKYGGAIETLEVDNVRITASSALPPLLRFLLGLLS